MTSSRDATTSPAGDDLRRAVHERDGETPRTDPATSEDRLHRLDLLLASIEDFVYLLDPAGRFLYANRALLDLWGLDLSDAVGRTFEELGYPAELVKKHRKQVERVIRTGEPVRSENPYTSPTGDGGHYEYIFTPMFDEKGEVEAIAGVTREITRRKRAEEALRRQEERARLATEIAGIGTWRYEPGTRRVRLDERMREIWGEEDDASEIPLRRVLRRIHPGDRSRVTDAIDRALDPFSEDDYTLDCRLVWPDGEERWVTANGRAWFEGRGPERRPVGLIGTALDMTDIRRAIAEREALVRELESERAHLEEASRAKSEFLAVMSHELRTPLNAIIGYVDLLLEGIPEPIPGTARAQVSRVRSSARHLQHLIDEVLTFSRLEAGHEELHPERLDAGTLAAETAALIEPLAREKGLEFVCRIEGDRLGIEVDSGKLRQILLNLLSNAVKFTEEGEVRLEVRMEGDEAVFEVRDTGIGIPADEREAIFEPFRQASTGAGRRAAGTGLGLSVSTRLTRMLGGTLEVESTPGEGSVFTVRLPR